MTKLDQIIYQWLRRLFLGACGAQHGGVCCDKRKHSDGMHSGRAGKNGWRVHW